MAVRRFIISFVTLITCCSPTLADTLNSFRQAHGLPAHERKMWRGVAPRKAARSACGKDRQDIAPTCCCPMSEAMGLHRLPAGAAAIGVSCLAGSRRDHAIA